MNIMDVNVYDVLKLLIEVIIASVAATVAVWNLIKKHVAREINAESGERKLADSRIEEKLVSNNEDVHINMGKTELIDIRLHELERERIKATYDLKTELQESIHRLELKIERLSQVIEASDRRN